MTRKAKQIGARLVLALAIGWFNLPVVGAEPTNDGAAASFLPIPGEVPAAPEVKPAPPAPILVPVAPPVIVPVEPPAPVTAPLVETITKTNRPPATGPSTPEPRRHSSSSQSNSDWALYNRNRYSKVLFDGKLVDIATLEPLVGFLAKEHTALSNGRQTFYGAALDIAEQKADAGKVAAAMELRPALWRRTNERVFLLNYKSSTTIPGILFRVYGQEIEPLEGVRTFKVGTDPTFEDWKRLAGR